MISYKRIQDTIKYLQNLKTDKDEKEDLEKTIELIKEHKLFEGILSDNKLYLLPKDKPIKIIFDESSHT